MTPFLRQIAELFYKEQGTSISDTCFVFPSRRAGKFFIKHLKDIANETLLAPECLTISEFFDSLSPDFEKEEKIGLLFHLYDSYKTITGYTESFNEFIGIGEIILKDFNDIDNYLVNAKYIFSNIEELKRYEKENLLTEEQIKCIEKFLGLFTEDCSEYKQKTYKLWNMMLEIYNHFKEKLSSEKICYDGMQHRMVVENPIAENLLPNQVVFIGFNALDGTTRRLFDILSNKGIADFYWDYDFKYAEISEDKYNKAHYFTKENLQKYKSKYNLEKESYPETTIHTIGCSSNIGQTKYSNEILKNISKEDNGINTALILADESLLIPMLYAIPEKESVNITMGYPIKYTTTYNFVDLFLKLHKNFKAEKGFNNKDANEIIDHPYIKNLCNEDIDKLDKTIYNTLYISENKFDSNNDLIKLIFTPCDDYNKLLVRLLEITAFLQKNLKEKPEENEDELTEKSSKDFDIECLNQASMSINKTISLLKRYPNIDIDKTTVYKIVMNVLKLTNLSFLGEPLSGLQMMGMLETRCLDFDNIIITSFNEGIFPKSDIGTSLIPYSIRKPYGLPTTDHQDAIFSYNFYRLIKRASNVWLIYDTRNNNDTSTGEVSRFAKQLEYIYGVKIDKNQVMHTPTICKVEEKRIIKSEDDIKDIKYYLEKTHLSASALNTYINCPLQFYYQHIKGIRDDNKKITTFNGALIGSLFHNIMEEIYDQYNLKNVDKSDLNKISEKEVQELTRKCIILKVYDLKNIEDTVNYDYTLTGENKIIFEIIVKFVMNILECDKRRTPFKHISNEEKYTIPYTTSKGNQVVLKGYIDKIDETENTVYLIDYKTTKINSNLNATTVEDLDTLRNFFYQGDDDKIYKNNSKKYVKEILQMCFYNLLYSKKTNKEIETYLFLVRKSFDHENFLLNTQVTLPEDWDIVFKENLDNIIDELLDIDKPILQTKYKNNCKYCPFTTLCGRK